MSDFTNGLLSNGARTNGLLKGTVSAFADAGYHTGAQSTQRAQMIDPLITGYGFIKWIHLPKWLPTQYGSEDAQVKHMLQKNFKSLSGLDNLTLNTAATTAGLSTNETHWATSIQKAQGFSINQQEYTGAPMSELYKLWITGIRDPRTNVAMYPHWSDDGQYGSRYHTGEMIYIQMRPDAYNTHAAGANIEYACYFTNIMPTVIPRDFRNFTQGTNDLVEFEQQFTGDQHESQQVMDLAQSIISAQDDLFVFTSESGFVPASEA